MIRNEGSSSLEKKRLFTNSRGRLAFEVGCQNNGAADAWMHIHDSSVAATPGSQAFAATASTDLITLTGAQTTWATGTPVRFSTTDTLPGGLVANQTYYLIHQTDPGDYTVYKVAMSLANAINNKPIDITTAGTGTHTANVLTWVSPLGPVYVPSGGGTLNEVRWWASDDGVLFEGGIYAILSSSPTATTLVAANDGLFSANYSR